MKFLRTFSIMVASLSLLASVVVPSFALAQQQPTLAPIQPTPIAQPVGPTPSTQTPGAAVTPGTPATPAAATPAATPPSFVPLTQLPGLSSTASSATLPALLNQLYKICIGVAAVVAVIQIMYAGVQFMVNKGSVSTNEAAKSRIQNAIIGLVLVLSPTIVFSIINPDILKLDLNFSELLPDALEKLDGSDVAAGQFTGADTNLWQNIGDPVLDAKRCSASGGTLVYECRKKDESGGKQVSVSDTCATDENKLNVCKASVAAPTNKMQCDAQYPSTKIVPINNGSSAGTVCSAAGGAIAISHGCCSGAVATGYQCCGIPAASSRYLLAYYTVVTNTSPKPSCYLPNYQFYPTEVSCKTDLQKYSSQAASGSVSKPTIVKSCELTPAINYTVPGPTGLAICSN